MSSSLNRSPVGFALFEAAHALRLTTTWAARAVRTFQGGAFEAETGWQSTQSASGADCAARWRARGLPIHPQKREALPALEPREDLGAIDSWKVFCQETAKDQKFAPVGRC
mgnify:CR=1 FL=1